MFKLLSRIEIDILLVFRIWYSPSICATQFEVFSMSTFISLIKWCFAFLKVWILLIITAIPNYNLLKKFNLGTVK